MRGRVRLRPFDGVRVVVDPFTVTATNHPGSADLPRSGIVARLGGGSAPSETPAAAETNAAAESTAAEAPAETPTGTLPATGGGRSVLLGLGLVAAGLAATGVRRRVA